MSLCVWPGAPLTALSAGLQRCDRCHFGPLPWEKRDCRGKCSFMKQCQGGTKALPHLSGRNNRAALLCQTFSFKSINKISGYMHLAHSKWKHFFLVIFSCSVLLKCEQFACSMSKGEVFTVKCGVVWIKAFPILFQSESFHVDYSKMSQDVDLQKILPSSQEWIVELHLVMKLHP